MLSKAQLAGVQNPDPLVQTGLRIITLSVALTIPRTQGLIQVHLAFRKRHSADAISKLLYKSVRNLSMPQMVKIEQHQPEKGLTSLGIRPWSGFRSGICLKRIMTGFRVRKRVRGGVSVRVGVSF